MTLKFIKNSSEKYKDYAIDSRKFGNYKNSEFPANVKGAGTKQVSGFSEYWKANNIYDLSGNAWEWTNEIYKSLRVLRGGTYFLNGLDLPAGYRGNYDLNNKYSSIGFRVSLYIK